MNTAKDTLMRPQNGDTCPQNKYTAEADVCPQNGDTIPTFAPTPSIEEAFDLIMGGIPHEAPSEVILLLLWMLRRMKVKNRDYCSDSVRELARLMCQGKNTVDRALTWAGQHGICVGFNAFQNKGGALSFWAKWDTQGPKWGHGWNEGHRVAPNWSALKELRDIHAGKNTPLGDQGSTCPTLECGSRKGEGEGLKCSRASVPDISSRALDELIGTLNDRFLLAASLQGIHNAKDMVFGGNAARDLRKFLGTLAPPATGIWTSGARTINLFTLWVENHPRKNLDSPLQAFIKLHGPFLSKLEKWESENPDAEYVTLPTKVVSAVKDSAEPQVDQNVVSELAANTYDFSGFSPSSEALTKILCIETSQEIMDALKEYVSGEPESKRKSAAAAFFRGDVAATVINARRRRLAERLAEQKSGTVVGQKEQRT
jgi:hypothetical protein